MKIKLCKNVIISMTIKKAGSVLCIPGDIEEKIALSLIDQGLADWQDTPIGQDVIFVPVQEQEETHTIEMPELVVDPEEDLTGGDVDPETVLPKRPGKRK